MSAPRPGVYLAVLLLIGQVDGATGSPAFDSFVQRHHRPYSHGSEEYKQRASLFVQRAAEVERHNSRPKRMWTAGINALSDRTHEELARLRGWRGVATPGRGVGSLRRHGLFLGQSGRGRALPSEFLNWTSLATVASVVDQGSCGSCWAVTGATVLGSHAEIYGSSARTFSVQELLSCVPNPHSCGGDGGCAGATVELAFDYALRRGLSSASEVPYTALTGVCRKPEPLALLASPSQTDGSDDLAAPGVHMAANGAGGIAFGMQGWERLPENRYEPLLRAVVERGPVAVSVAASTWFNYESGIFDDCPKDAVIDHAVTLLGFGRDRELNAKYWLIQNSWGETWGEKGRIRLLRRDGDESEYCGTDSQPQQGTGCKGGPAQVRVCGMCGILYDTVVPYFSKPTL